MNPGRFDKRVEVLRADVLPGARRGNEFKPVATLWGDLRPDNGRETVVGGRVIDTVDAVLVIRNGVEARKVTSADRVRVQGREWRILSAGLPDRRAGTITLQLSSQPGR